MKTSTLFFIIGAILAAPAMATTFPSATTPFSEYGQIQNVQNYSSNPFWNPDSPYNQTMPVPIYVTGPNVDTSDCTAIVGALVSSFCASRNNCVGMDISEARPTLTIQLASLPNRNYVTPCAGYIETEFDKYKSQNAVAAPTGHQVAFPTATTPNTNANTQKYQFQNPANPQLPTWQGDPWMQEMLDRENELKNLQSANGGGGEHLARADFPKTANDLTFSQRTQLDAAGYEPYKDASAYEPLNLKNISNNGTTAGQLPGQQLAGLSGAIQSTTGCENAKQQLEIYLSDLQKLDECKNVKKKFNDCYAELQGQYTYAELGQKALSTNSSADIDLGYTERTIGSQKVFSIVKSDCLIDPVTKDNTCCNVHLEKSDRNVNIGGYMFCGYEVRDASGNVTSIEPVYGMVRQCLQNKKKTTDTPDETIGGWFKNDFWSQTCEPRYCSGYTAPMPGIEGALKWDWDEKDVCWKWECPDGYDKVNNACFSNNDSLDYDTLLESIEKRYTDLLQRCANYI